MCSGIKWHIAPFICPEIIVSVPYGPLVSRLLPTDGWEHRNSPQRSYRSSVKLTRTTTNVKNFLMIVSSIFQLSFKQISYQIWIGPAPFFSLNLSV